MNNEILINELDERSIHQHELYNIENSSHPGTLVVNITPEKDYNKINDIAEILFITSYPPRECGIATYSQDLIKAIHNKFSKSLSIKVCALESAVSNFIYPNEVKFVLNTSNAKEYEKLATKINKDNCIKIVLIQHEFGFFQLQEQAFMQLLYELSKPVMIVFHTVLPNPDVQLKSKIKCIASVCESIIVMTNNLARILINDYGLTKQKISVIAHGTHLVPHLSEKFLKTKYGLNNRKVISTFGLISSGKSIETTLNALPSIVETCPEVLFLIIGKTHPEVIKTEGEKYREKLELIVEKLNLQNHVVFINNYLALKELLEYLQLTDIYLFTTSDPNQAVSGTFAYAMSCACPIISTPIPHALEVLTEDTGIIFDFRNSEQLAYSVKLMLTNNQLRKNYSTNTLQKIVTSAWENSAVLHTKLFEKIAKEKITVKYNFPAINLNHLKQLTTNTGIIQFSKINQPDIESGYTLDDNARALILMCMNYKLTGDKKSIFYIYKYFSFIKFCQQPQGNFFNYVDKDKNFTFQNTEINSDDANGRAIWALGYLISLSLQLNEEIITEAESIIKKSLVHLKSIHSTRAVAFAIKGLYYCNKTIKSPEKLQMLIILADRMVQLYKHESKQNWKWFESYLTYANSILPEAMVYSWLLTGNPIYKEIALTSLDFLLSHIFNENGIEVISNKTWLLKGKEAGHFGEQPIDVAYTIMTLGEFYTTFKNEDYRLKMEIAFNWFLGANRLNNIIYNPCTGGCYDGLEENNVNLNQGAESTLSYLMARFTMDVFK